MRAGHFRLIDVLCLRIGKYMMIPDYQTLMRPVLEAAADKEVRVGEVVKKLADQFGLSEEDRAELLPSGKQSRFSNRVHWAKTYLKQAGLVIATKRGHFFISDRGRIALENETTEINNGYLEKFKEFQVFKSKTKESIDKKDFSAVETDKLEDTPDEELRSAHQKITTALAEDLLDRARKGTPAFFEKLIVDLLCAMGYGGPTEGAGRVLGKSGDGGVDGVIDQDPLGVDQIYVQAKRYGEGNNVKSDAIRNFFGALNLKKAQKGIFVTTSAFSSGASQTSRELSSRIVLIDGGRLARLMIQYNIGCRNEGVLHLKKVDEDFFE